MDAIDAPSSSPLGQDRPLDGLKVVELATVLAGPLVGTFLAELGAEVIKVEPPGRGDVTRHWRSQGESAGGPSAYFAAANGPKRPMRLDLKSPSGQAELRAMLADADVLLQNAKPSSLKGLGLDPEKLQSRFPRLIHVHLKGFLHEPHRGGYDMAVQAETGFMSMNGDPKEIPSGCPWP